MAAIKASEREAKAAQKAKEKEARQFERDTAKVCLLCPLLFFDFFVFAETVAIGRQQKKQKGRTREKWPKSTRQVVLIPTPTPTLIN